MTLDAHRETTAVEAVYVEQRQKLFRSIVAYAGDRDIAEEAVAEAFAQALRRGSGLNEPERWIWRSAYRIAAGLLKDARRAMPSGAASTYEIIEAPAELSEALSKLPEKQRAAVILHYYADLKVRDVAAVMGTSSAAVKVSLMRARRSLRSLLETDDG